MRTPYRHNVTPVVRPGLADQQHFVVTRPLSTHFRAATCKETNCPHYLNGWTTIVPTVGPQADYIRSESGRQFKEEKKDDGLVAFHFSPGQRCFNDARAHEARIPLARHDHKRPLDKPELFTVSGIGHRTDAVGGRHGNITRTHERPEDWLEDCNERLYKVNRARR